MKIRLHPEDAAALDLLLDRTQVATGDGAVFAAPAAGQDRVNGARKVLGLLQLLPDAEPPRDLLTRTLSYVGDAVQGIPRRQDVPLAILESFQPHA